MQSFYLNSVFFINNFRDDVKLKFLVNFKKPGLKAHPSFRTVYYIGAGPDLDTGSSPV
jgi:hypothetical protein